MTAMTLLIMDVQQDIIERYARDGGYLDRLATAIADWAARLRLAPDPTGCRQEPRPGPAADAEDVV